MASGDTPLPVDLPGGRSEGRRSVITSSGWPFKRAPYWKPSPSLLSSPCLKPVLCSSARLGSRSPVGRPVWLLSGIRARSACCPAPSSSWMEGEGDPGHDTHQETGQSTEVTPWESPVFLSCCYPGPPRSTRNLLPPPNQPSPPCPSPSTLPS